MVTGYWYRHYLFGLVCALVLKPAKKNLAISSFIIWLCLKTMVVHVSEQDSTILPAGNCMLSLQEKFS